MHDSFSQQQVTNPSQYTSDQCRQKFLLNKGIPLLNLKRWQSTASIHSWWGGYTTVPRQKPTGFCITATFHIAPTLVFWVLAPRMPLCSYFSEFWSCKFHARHFHSHEERAVMSLEEMFLLCWDSLSLPVLQAILMLRSFIYFLEDQCVPFFVLAPVCSGWLLREGTDISHSGSCLLCQHSPINFSQKFSSIMYCTAIASTYYTFWRFLNKYYP